MAGARIEFVRDNCLSVPGVLCASDTNRKCQWIPSAERFCCRCIGVVDHGHEEALLAPQSTSS